MVSGYQFLSSQVCSSLLFDGGIIITTSSFLVTLRTGIGSFKTFSLTVMFMFDSPAVHTVHFMKEHTQILIFFSHLNEAEKIK